MATVRVWDKNWNLIAEVTQGWRCDEPDVIVVPLDHPVAKWITSQDRPDLRITVDSRGTRWSGRLGKVTRRQSVRGDEILRAAFNVPSFIPGGGNVKPGTHCAGHELPSANDALFWAIQTLGDLTAMIPGLAPLPKPERIAKLERAVRVAQGHRAATYERLQGTPRNGHWHPSLADPRTLADQRLVEAQDALTRARRAAVMSIDDQLYDVRVKIRQARFDNNLIALDVLEDQMNHLLDAKLALMAGT